MVNCNPETVSTDYDTSDRLYFEPLTAEDVIALIRKEQEQGEVLGCIVQYGGQTPLKLSQSLAAAGIPILGTSADAIDLAEDRERFQALLQKLGLRQPRTARPGPRRRRKQCGPCGLPRRDPPQLRLGAAMEIVHDRTGLPRYMREAVVVSGSSPVLIDHYLNDAIRGGRGLHLGRRDGLCRRCHGAHRGSGHTLRRQRLLLAALLLSPSTVTELKGADGGDGAGHRRGSG